MTGSGSLHVRRHVVTYRCVAGGSRIGSGFDADLADELTGCLGDSLAAVDLSAADGVWLIRRLDLRAVIGTTWSAHRCARAVARSVALEVARTVADGADGAGVIWFPDRATFIGRYLVDAARGRAAHRWEYADLPSPGSDPAAAIVAVSADAPVDMVDAVRGLTEDEVDDVLRVLSRSEASLVLSRLAVAGDVTTFDALRAVVDALGAVPGARGLAVEHVALALFAHGVRAGAPASADTSACAVRLASLVAVLGRERPERAARVGAAVAAGAWSELDAATVADLVAIVSWSEHARRAAVEAALGAVRTTSTGVGGDELTMTTRLGGLFLLLPLLDELPLEAATEGWPPLDGVDAHTLMRFAVLIAALGPDRHARAAIDPVMRLVCGVPAALTASALSAWLDAVPAAAVEAFEAAVVGRLLAHGRLSGDLVLSPTPLGVAAIDTRRGLLVALAQDDPASIRELVARLVNTYGGATHIDATEPWIDACLPEAVRRGDTDGAPRPADALAPGRLTAIGDDIGWTRLGQPFDLDRRISSAVLVSAQVILRDLAWRLPGLAHSSLPYLWTNVLASSASIEFEPDRVVVTLAPAPMHLLLSLTGMNRRQISVPAAGSRPWIVAQA